MKLSDEIMLDREDARNNPSLWYTSSSNGIVTSAHYKATEAGAQVLAMGGNAVDAAVATSLALGVVEPAGSGLGGMGMMMVHLKKEARTFVIEGPCRAPAKAKPEIYISMANEYMNHRSMESTRENLESAAGIVRKSGYPAIAIPTNPATLSHALKNYGSMNLEQIMAPAISLAENGYLITPFQNKLMTEYRSQVRKGNAASLLFGGSDDVPKSGTLVKNPSLAKTLKHLSRHGLEDFYNGAIGKEIVEDMRLNNGFITADDMANIPWPRESRPINGNFKDWKIMSTPPPGGGTTLIQMLNLFEAMTRDNFDPDTPEAAVLFASIINKARIDRRDSFKKAHDKSENLSSGTYASQTADRLRANLSGEGETTHFNAIDRYGNVVSMTQSIERSFGSKIATPGLGFLYNGFMKAFKLRNKKHPHYLKPGAVARSNASPTIVFKDKKPIFAIGSTGSERIASSMFQVLTRLLNQSPFEAVKAPRLHCTPERQVFLEAERFSTDTISLLKKHGFEINPYDAWSFSVGGLHLAGTNDNKCWGVAEPRRDGAAAGY
ncbi:MAG: gamma-glutamyltransferase [Burkholderiales bacterium]|nr:gamma-glutamyltransferase [Burkholderiales bacterium]MDR4518239.1 gamma-glutamyltransferase [Nitrosomonas sp.]